MAKNKLKKKKYTSFFLQFCIGIVALISGILLCTFVFFKAENLEITGLEMYSTEDILDAIDLEKGENLVFINTKNIEEQIFRLFPYVEKVSVKKVIPSTIQIRMTQAETYYSVKFGKNYAHVSKNGKLLQVASFVEDGSIEVNLGAIEDYNGYIKAVDPDQDRIFKEVLTLFKETEIENITEMDFSDKYELQIVYDERIRFELGTSSDLSFKIKFGLLVLDSGQISESDKGSLDLSLGRELNKAYFLSDSLQTYKDNTAIDFDENVDDNDTSGQLEGGREE